MYTQKIKGIPLDITKREIRYRIKEPKKFDEDSFRRKQISDGVSIVIACPKGKFEDNKCGVGTQTQAFRFDRSTFTPEEAAKWIKKYKRK